tara:strand:- start:2077 stop:3378 length:1302 start_codon:yes stop_codon:yes gene_type:complete
MAISPFFKPTKVIRPAGGLISAAKNNIRSIQTKTQNISEPRSDNKSQKFGSAYTNFFGSKKTVKILQKNLTAIKKSLASTFEIAIALRKSIAQMAKGFGGGGKGGLFGGLFGGLGGILGIAGGLFGLISAAVGILTNPWILGIAGGGLLWLLSKKEFRDAITPIVKFVLNDLIAENVPLVKYFTRDEDITDMNSRVGASINEIGEERTLALLKLKRNQMEASGENTRSIDKRIKKLEEQGFIASSDSGQTISDLEKFDSKVSTLKDIQSDKNEEINANKVALFNKMIQELPENLRNKVPYRVKDGELVPDHMAGVRSALLGRKDINKLAAWNIKFSDAAANMVNQVDAKYQNKIKVENKNKVKEVSSVNKNNNNMNATIVPFKTGGGKETGGGQKLVNSNANTTTSSDIAWFNSRNTDMYGCFKTAAECNITV